MKKLISILFTAVIFFTACNDFDGLEARVETLEDKVAKLETLCDNMNTNISSLQALVKALGNRDYVESILPVTEDGIIIGYTVKFAKMDDVTIYTGTNTASPVIGAKEYTDGIYYWTLYGEWIVDANGNKIGISVTPTLKVDNNQWFVSWDNGLTWSKLNIAIQDDSVSFANVETDEENAYFTLADGTQIVLPLVTNNIAAQVQSISYIPRYNDNKIPIWGVSPESGYIEMDFNISPKNIIKKIENKWKDILCIKAVYTKTRAVSYVELPVTAFSSDETNGIITVRASTMNFSKELFSGDVSASVALHIEENDYDVSSEYIQIYPTGTRVVAHRGYWDTEGSAQNSIASLIKADEIGVWGCEFDVWQTADGVMVLNHDGIINGISIQDAKYSEIKDFTLNNGETLPTLKNYLETYKNKHLTTKLILEIKSHSTNEKKIKVSQDIVTMVHDMKLQNDVEYISFDKTSCEEIIRIDSFARVAFLEGSGAVISEFAEKSYTGIDFHYSFYNPDIAQDAKEHGLETNIWTVNYWSTTAKAIEYGIDVITTDKPVEVTTWITQILGN